MYPFHHHSLPVTYPEWDESDTTEAAVYDAVVEASYPGDGRLHQQAVHAVAGVPCNSSTKALQEHLSVCLILSLSWYCTCKRYAPQVFPTNSDLLHHGSV